MNTQVSSRSVARRVPGLARASAGLASLAALAGCQSPPTHAAIEQMNCNELRHNFALWGQQFFNGRQEEPRGDLREHFVLNCSGWPEHVKAYVLRDEIHEGMTRDMVWWAWGPPLSTRHSAGPLGQSETWEWSVSGSTRPVCTFRDGALVWWNQP